MTQSNVQRVVGYMNDLAPIYGFGGTPSGGRMNGNGNGNGNTNVNVASNGGYAAITGHGAGMMGGAGSWVAPPRNGLGNGQVKERIDLTRSGSYG